MDAFLTAHDTTLEFLKQNPTTPAPHLQTGDQSWPFADGRYRIFFKFNGKVIDIKDYEEKNLDIFSRKILKMICKGETGWEEMLPEGTAEIIKKEKLFSYACEVDFKEVEKIN